MWQRSNVFSVDGRFSGTADEKPAEGRQVAVRRPRSLQGGRDGAPGEGAEQLVHGHLWEPVTSSDSQ